MSEAPKDKAQDQDAGWCNDTRNRMLKTSLKPQAGDVQVDRAGVRLLIEGPRDADASDAPFHDAILDNRAADALLARAAVLRALARGLPREKAERLFGIPSRACWR